MSCFTLLMLLCIIVIQINPSSCRTEDYWSDDFDSGQNCEKPEEIAKLLKMNPSQCNIIRGESDEQAFSLCKTHLTAILQKKCEYSKVENPGELLYCKKRGAVTCK